MWTRGQNAGVQIPDCHSQLCDLGELPSLSVPQFPVCHMEIRMEGTTRLLQDLNELLFVWLGSQPVFIKSTCPGYKYRQHEDCQASQA